MNRLLLFVLILYSQAVMGQLASDILLDFPSKTNDVLLHRHKVNQEHNIEIQRALLGKHFSTSKNDDAIQEVTHVQSGKTFEVCIDTTSIAGNFGSLLDLNCATLLTGSIVLNQNCFSYTANTGVILGRDTLCLQLCDKDNDCSELIFPIEVRNPVPIPFFEDFATSNVVPNEDMWQNTDVFINNTNGIDPPSIGMATFDGINKFGRPYGTGHGPSDRLTSTFIDINSFGPTDDVYLSFWVQPQGFGDRPEEIDSLVLEFKDENGNWNSIKKFDGIPIDTPSTKRFQFTRESIRIADNKYFHDGFQFRFTNYSTNTGAIDLWHVDYITITDNSSPNAGLKDLAFTRVPDPIIKTYSALPWKHFLEAPDLLRDSFRVELFNHFDQSIIATSSIFFVTEKVTSTFPMTSFQPLLTTAQENVNPAAAIRYENALDNFASFKSNMENNYITNDSLIFNVQYSFDQNDEEREALDNNIVSRNTVFDNYFAYDDGTAETNIIAQNRGTEIGVEFYAYTADSLRAISISFVNVTGADLTNELFNLKIYIGELDGNPEFENVLLKPVYANSLFDTLQSFSTYALIDPVTEEPMAVPIPADTKFFIGIQTASDNEIPIGFDRNSLESADKNYVALSTGWFPFPPTHQGAVLLRPIFGDVTPQSTNTVSTDPPAPISDLMRVYPNPTSGILNFNKDGQDLTRYQYRVFNALGQKLSTGYLSPQINFGHLDNGLYFMQVISPIRNKIYQHRFLVAK